MQIRLQLSLPRDARYVTTLRSVAQCMLEDINAPREAVEDVQLALSEACNNAIRHASGSDEYSVSLALGEDGCEIEVVDLGPGFVPPLPEDLGALAASATSEAGRGLVLMHALVDGLEFVDQHDGTHLRLRKHWDGFELPADGALLRAPRDGPGGNEALRH